MNGTVTLAADPLLVDPTAEPKGLAPPGLAVPGTWARTLTGDGDTRVWNVSARHSGLGRTPSPGGGMG
jgi:hypothetical protein